MVEEQKTNNGGYKVPDGYFEQMRAQVMGQVRELEAERAAAAARKVPAWRSAAAFAASFAALVVLAVGGFYLTGYQAQKQEVAAAAADQAMWLYEVEEIDLYELDAAKQEPAKAVLAEAAIDYLETFGSLSSGELSNE